MHNKCDLVLVSKSSAPYITLCDFVSYLPFIEVKFRFITFIYFLRIKEDVE